MALNLAHQIGALCGTPVVAEIGAAAGGEQPSTSAVWMPQASGAPNLRCQIKRAGEVEQEAPSMSPSQAPALSAIRRDLSVACKALVADAEAVTADEEAETEVRKHGAGEAGNMKGVPVYVMLPLDTVRPGGVLNRKKAMNASMEALKSAGVEGVMVDVWWGLVERERPQEYDWRGYEDLMEIAQRIKLKVQAVMSFHQCGGNVGDSVTIPLPQWVLEAMDKDQDLTYTDRWGRRNYEYVSLGCDKVSALRGRTPIKCYADFMRAFRDHFRHLLGTTIIEIQVGMGPAGELRYPSYPEQNGTWRFPGVGAFQCYDKYMLDRLKDAAKKAGKPEWGHGGPTDAGGYNNWPEDTDFFRKEGGWNCPYGEFFLSWYSDMLLEHGERILSSATPIFDSTRVRISVKVAGIHWHYGTRSHASELTAGYYNTRFHDGYLPIAQMLKRYNAVFNFTCVEMRNHEQSGDACCRPEELVKQVAAATREAGVRLAGENALPRYDEAAHQQIIKTATLGAGEQGKMVAFTYLRMGSDIFHEDNWRRFVAFVKRMAEGREALGPCREQVEREAERSVQATGSLVHEAVMALMSG